MDDPARTTAHRSGRRTPWPTLLLLLLLLAGALVAPADAGARPLPPPLPGPPSARLLIPAYAYPSGTTWQRLCSALHATGRPAVLIMNPDNGPGQRVDANYRRALQDCQQRFGQTVIGYVATSYGQRPIAQVMADVERYARSYPGVRGIFLDEMSNDPATEPHYVAIRNAIRARAPRAMVVGNPGAAASTPWQLTAPAVADVLVVFEGRANDYLRWSPPLWTRQARRPSNLAHLVHSAPSRLPSALVCAAWRRHPSAYVYVTRDVMPNPWDRLSLHATAESCLP